MKFIDLTNQTFGKLTVIERDLNNNKRGTYWICKCNCKNQTIKSIRSTHLIAGEINSCGCISKETKVDWRKDLLKQGIELIYIDNKHELRSTIYDIYNRCYNPKFKHYEYYKSNNITVSKEFHNGYIFAKYLMSLPDYEKRKELNLTVDRIDNNKGYERNNLRWTTKTIQRLNQREADDQISQKYFKATYKDGTIIISNNRREFCREYNINRGNMFQVLSGNKQSVKGWKFDWIEDNKNE
jgi:hypothetical protein